MTAVDSASVRRVATTAGKLRSCSLRVRAMVFCALGVDAFGAGVDPLRHSLNSYSYGIASG